MDLSITQTKELWQRILNNLNQRLNDKTVFEYFFDKSYIFNIENSVMTIVLNGPTSKQLVSTKYKDLLTEIVTEVTESNFKLEFIIEEEKEKNNKHVKQEEFFKASSLNPSHTFDTFVIGAFNRSAAQAALCVATTPGKMFNPLFIHSDSGLGKTHLLHAIGNYVKTNIPGSKIICITSDDFFNEFTNSLLKGKDTNPLREYCKTVDVFLIDDIQFLNNKEKTQELFYYVFNDLVSSNKQIVITSDRHPDELQGMEKRLVTRFVSGLTEKINDPDPSTCVEILKKKIQSLDNLNTLTFDDDALDLLANKFSKNIRELEGALNKLVYQSILNKTNHVDLNLAIDAVSTISGGKYVKDEINEEKIISIVADYYNITKNVLIGNSRIQQVSLARHIAMFLIQDTLGSSLKKIGAALGGRDHTTVMHGISKVEKMLKNDPTTQNAIKELKLRIKKD